MKDAQFKTSFDFVHMKVAKIQLQYPVYLAKQKVPLSELNFDFCG